MGAGKRFRTEFKEEAGCLGGIIKHILSYPDAAACLTVILAIIAIPIWLISLPFRLLKVIRPKKEQN